ncbi:KH domain-containing protein [Patescibacteria group bacterium]|nr:KH domain-containing protein [Patescibacteria group bacterium]MBU0963850.1 KH domain-containing protein [Patescibacteria group bacterium]
MTAKKEPTETRDQEFVEYVVRSLVDRPDDVSSDRTVDEMGVLITLKVNPADLGQVIGRQGQTAKAIRTLLRVVGAKNHARVNLKIHEPEGFRKEDRSPRPAADTSAVDDLKI